MASPASHDNATMAGEPPTFAPTAAATVQIMQSVRKMRCYTVTQSELHSIGLANFGSNVAFAIAAGLFGYGMDIVKDVTTTVANDQAANAFRFMVQPICFWGAGIFAAIGLGFMIWRFVQIWHIKKEGLIT